MKYRRVTQMRSADREGTTLVEMALVLPVFLVFLFGIIEFGHAFMISGALGSAAKVAAREAVGGGATSQDVRDRVLQKLGPTMNTASVTVLVKDASAVATQGTAVDFAALPDIEVSTAPPGKLYLVRVEVPYETVTAMSPFWIKNISISGQALMRHE